MRKLLTIAVLMFGCTLSAMAWNCTTPGQVRVQVPTGTVGNGTGDGSGQVVVDSGLTFICEALPTATPTSNGTVATATNTNTNTSASSSTANSSATGGNASSTATGGNATSNQTQGQKQTQSNSSTNNNKSQGGSVSDVGNSSTVVDAAQTPVNTATAPPVFSTVNCFKGYSGGAQTAVAGLSFGGGGIDKNCAAERIAQDYYAMGNRLAACKVITTTKASKAAGVTLEDCMHVAQRPVVAPAPVATPVVPAPSITVNFPVYQFPQDTVAPKAPPVVVKKPVAKKHVGKPCIIPPSLKSEGSSS